MPTPCHAARTAESAYRQRPSTETAARPTAALARTGTQTGGQALDRHTQARMSARFGHDFSSVRIHTDDRAARTAGAVGANAFAHGADIVFGEGQWTPGSFQTERLLAHELTHVVQQDRWGVGDWGRASAKGDTSEKEADTVASQVMAGRSVDVQAAPGAAVARDEGDPSTLVSRLGDPEPDRAGPVYGPPNLPAGSVFGPQASPNAKDVSSPLDTPSRADGMDPDPVGPSCGMDTYPWGLSTIRHGGEKPGDFSGPYSYWSANDDDEMNTTIHNEVGLYHGHAASEAANLEATSDIGYGNADIGTFKDDMGMEHFGGRANAGLLNATVGAGPLSLNVQGATVGGEFSADRHGFTASAGATAAGVTGGYKGEHVNASLGVSEGISLGLGFRCGDSEGGGTQCCSSAAIGPASGQFCADDKVAQELLQPIGETEESRKAQARHAAWLDIQRSAYVGASPEQRKRLPHTWSDVVAALSSDAEFERTPPAARVCHGSATSEELFGPNKCGGDFTPEDIFGYSTLDPVCRADEPVCHAPIPPSVSAPSPDALSPVYGPPNLLDGPVYGPQSFGVKQ